MDIYRYFCFFLVDRLFIVIKGVRKVLSNLNMDWGWLVVELGLKIG